MKTLKKTGWLVLVGTLTFSTARSDDTDIYLNPSVPTGGEPLVMFVIDYRPNLGSTACNGTECDTLIAEGFLPATGPYTFFDVLRGALKKVFEPIDGVKVGLMINHADTTTGKCGAGPQAATAKDHCSNGGYIMMGFNSLDASDSNGAKALFHSKLAGLPPTQGNLSHIFQGKELYFEFFRYLTGQGVYNGHSGWDDYDITDKAKNLNEVYPKIAWDTGIETANGADYISPLTTISDCSRIFVINLMFQVSNQEDDSDSTITDTKANGGMAGINLGGNRNSFDTVIGYLNDVDLADGSFGTAPNIDGDQNVTSYFIVDPTKINQTTGGYAQAGGTGAPLALSDNPDELIETLNNIFKSILSISTTFVAPAVPVNVFNRAETVNEVFMALFKPAETPRWNGNLKKLRIKKNPVSNQFELQDTTSINAIDIDGRIKREALTWWTRQADLPILTSADAQWDDATADTDGRAVARGASGQQVPGFISGNPGVSNSPGPRWVFTQNDSGNGLMAFDVDDPTATSLWPYLTADWSAPAASFSTATTAEKTRVKELIAYARGLEDDGAGSWAGREWVVGDPLHSRPKPVNYGDRDAAGTGYDQDNPDIRILMGANDGMMHMFRNHSSGGVEDGSETWAFMPRKMMHVLDRLYSNTLGGTPIHPITLDGSAAVYSVDKNLDGNLIDSDGDLVHAYFGLRRGGKDLYALDISDPDAPDLLWQISKVDPDFSEMGQTWSTPQLGNLRINGTKIPVLVFGGGYNGDDDGDNLGDLGKDAANRITPQTVGTDDDEGNAIFIVNALNGSLVWKAKYGASAGYSSTSGAYSHPGLKDSIPAEITAIDTNNTGLLDRIYATDTGGNIWRVDLASWTDTDSDGTADTFVNDDPSLWTVRHLFKAGRHLVNDVPNDRRMFNRVDVVLSRDATGPYDAVLVGTGDRENPNGTSVDNWMYVVKDRNIMSGKPPAAGSPLIPSNLADLTSNCLQDGSCGTAPVLTNGWRFQLLDSGEKGLSAAVTAGGVIYFTTFSPQASGSACALSEGTGYLYAVSLQDGTAAYNFNTANDTALAETYERRVKLASGGIPVEAVPLGQGQILVQGREGSNNVMQISGRTSFKTFWHEHER